MVPEVIQPLDRPSPKNEKSAYIYGFNLLFCFIDFDKIRKKSEKFKQKTPHGSANRRFEGGSGYMLII